MRKLRRQTGQSLIGMLVVLVIIGIVFWYMFGGTGEESGGMNPVETVEKGKEVQTQSELNVLKQAIRLYRATEGRYPPDLEALVEADHVPRSALTGPDGEEYQYTQDNGSVKAP